MYARILVILFKPFTDINDLHGNFVNTTNPWWPTYDNNYNINTYNNTDEENLFYDEELYVNIAIDNIGKDTTQMASTGINILLNM